MKKVLTFFLMTIVSLGMFQNCGQGGFQVEGNLPLNFLDSSSTGSDTNHPGEPIPSFDTYQEPLVNKLYIARVLRDIFATNDGDVEGRLHDWVKSKGANFGIGCNAYDTYAAQDCGGDTANANTGVRQSANTMRELFHLRICSELVGLNPAVESAMGKAGLIATSAVNADSVKAVYQLFYRVEEPDSTIIQIFTDLDQNLAGRGLAQKERWRAILVSICDSPGWQQF